MGYNNNCCKSVLYTLGKYKLVLYTLGKYKLVLCTLGMYKLVLCIQDNCMLVESFLESQYTDSH